MPDDLNFN